MKFHQKLTYAGFVIFHPFKGFWDIKNERKGDLKVSLFYLVLLYVSMLLHECLGGYLFRENENTVSVVRVSLELEIGGNVTVSRYVLLLREQDTGVANRSMIGLYIRDGYGEAITEQIIKQQEVSE